MGIIKDGNIYRTEYEQLVHLTEKHLEQDNINKDVNRQLNELSVASNLGGYNYVRFAFQKQGTYFKLSQDTLETTIPSEIGDYFEITSGVDTDIPAYGYFTENNNVAISFFGDFIDEYSMLTIRNVTKNISDRISVQYVQFEGTSLLDYNPQDKKKQLFNVIDDITYGSSTQYASFDLNNDNVYNYVFVGVVLNGRNGSSIFAINEETVQQVIEIMKQGDIAISTFSGTISNLQVEIGDIVRYITINNFIKIGNIRGEKGDKGLKGETGLQGAMGVQGVQGIQGIQGIQGEKGQNSPVLNLVSYLDNINELPEVSSVQNGDAYVVLNTSTPTITYDLFFKGSGSENWQTIPSFGPIKGDRGPQGPIGPQGIQGVQGLQGERGPAGGFNDIYEYTIIIRKTDGTALFSSTLLSYVNIDRITDYLFYLSQNVQSEIVLPSNGKFNSRNNDCSVYFATYNLSSPYNIKIKLSGCYLNTNNGLFYGEEKEFYLNECSYTFRKHRVI